MRCVCPIVAHGCALCGLILLARTNIYFTLQYVRAARKPSSIFDRLPSLIRCDLSTASCGGPAGLLRRGRRTVAAAVSVAVFPH